MAKKVHAYSLRGDYYHNHQVIAEYDKKTEKTSYYKLSDILAQFDGKTITVVIKEEDGIPSLEQPFNDGE